MPPTARRNSETLPHGVPAHPLANASAAELRRLGTLFRSVRTPKPDRETAALADLCEKLAEAADKKSTLPAATIAQYRERVQKGIERIGPARLRSELKDLGIDRTSTVFGVSVRHVNGQSTILLSPTLEPRAVQTAEGRILLPRYASRGDLKAALLLAPSTLRNLKSRFNTVPEDATYHPARGCVRFTHSGKKHLAIGDTILLPLAGTSEDPLRRQRQLVRSVRVERQALNRATAEALALVDQELRAGHFSDRRRCLPELKSAILCLWTGKAAAVDLSAAPESVRKGISRLRSLQMLCRHAAAALADAGMTEGVPMPGCARLLGDEKRVFEYHATRGQLTLVRRDAPGVPTEVINVSRSDTKGTSIDLRAECRKPCAAEAARSYPVEMGTDNITAPAHFVPALCEVALDPKSSDPVREGCQLALTYGRGYPDGEGR
jgi:hypothetical protein